MTAKGRFIEFCKVRCLNIADIGAVRSDCPLPALSEAKNETENFMFWLNLDVELSKIVWWF
jgi:hypothetical protein